MSIFGRIISKIFGDGDKPTTKPTGQPTPTTSAASHPGATTPAATAGAPRPVQTVDVDKVLADMAARNGQDLNWRTSIVDLLKLLDLDSSLQSRRELADELGYKGDKEDTATMNVWLIDAVTEALAQNGGRVPAALKD